MRDIASKSWRPFGFWALTLIVSFGFPVVVVGVFVAPDAPWSTITGMYTSVLFAWAAAAGIRQWGKHNGER